MIKCGECIYNMYDPADKEFYCGNMDSEYYGCENAYDDTCEEGEDDKGNDIPHR